MTMWKVHLLQSGQARRGRYRQQRVDQGQSHQGELQRGVDLYISFVDPAHVVTHFADLGGLDLGRGYRWVKISFEGSLTDQRRAD